MGVISHVRLAITKLVRITAIIPRTSCGALLFKMNSVLNGFLVIRAGDRSRRVSKGLERGLPGITVRSSMRDCSSN